MVPFFHHLDVLIGTGGHKVVEEPKPHVPFTLVERCEGGLSGEGRGEDMTELENIEHPLSTSRQRHNAIDDFTAL